MSVQEMIDLFYELAGEEFIGTREKTEDGFRMCFTDGTKFVITVKKED